MRGRLRILDDQPKGKKKKKKKKSLEHNPPKIISVCTSAMATEQGSSVLQTRGYHYQWPYQRIPRGD